MHLSLYGWSFSNFQYSRITILRKTIFQQHSPPEFEIYMRAGAVSNSNMAASKWISELKKWNDKNLSHFHPAHSKRTKDRRKESLYTSAIINCYLDCNRYTTFLWFAHFEEDPGYEIVHFNTYKISPKLHCWDLHHSESRIAICFVLYRWWSFLGC